MATKLKFQVSHAFVLDVWQKLIFRKTMFVPLLAIIPWHYSSQLQHSLDLHNLRVATSLAIVPRKVIKQHGKNMKIPGTAPRSPDPCPHYTTPECESSAKLVFPVSYACSFAQRVPKGQREELLPYMAQYQRCSFLLTGSTELFLH